MDSNRRSRLLCSTCVLIVFLLFEEVDGYCHNGYSEFNKSCYLFVDTVLKNWFQSRDHCKDLGHFLAEVSSPEEINFLKSGATARSKGTTCNAYWIGGTDMEQEGKWIWSTNSEPVTYTDWSEGQPDNTRNQDCLSLWTYIAFQWDDLSCDERRCFICKGISTFQTTSVTTTLITDEEIPESRTAETSNIETSPDDISKSKPSSIEHFRYSTQEPGPHRTTTQTESQDIGYTTVKSSTTITHAFNQSAMSPPENETCRCFCYQYESEDDIKSSILRLKTSLTVNKTRTSKYKRNLISAQDHRVSSKAMGYVGVLILISVFSLIVALDVARIMNHVFSGRKLNRKLNSA